jgi:hypothetical protein
MPLTLPTSKFKIGDAVRVLTGDRNRTPHAGTVRQIIWHHKKQAYLYFLEEGGKKVAKRYFDEDLELTW